MLILQYLPHHFIFWYSLYVEELVLLIGRSPMSQHHHFHVWFYKWIVGFYVCSLLLLEVSTPPVFKCLFAVFYFAFPTPLSRSCCFYAPVRCNYVHNILTNIGGTICCWCDTVIIEPVDFFLSLHVSYACIYLLTVSSTTDSLLVNIYFLLSTFVAFVF